MSTPAVKGGSPERSWPLWEVFVRGKRGLSHVHVGSLHAGVRRGVYHRARLCFFRRRYK